MKKIIFQISAMITILSFACALRAADKYYIGTGGDLKASTAANWLDGTVPVDGDTVVLDANAANSNLTWDIDVTLAGWRQSDYTGTVTFRTGLPYEGFALNGVDGEVDHGVAAKVLKVTGDVTLASGTWTHLVHGKTPFSKTHERCLNGLGVYRLQVEIGGNLTIGEGATLTSAGKGFYSCCGPGVANTTSQRGASHGGVGASGLPTYGSTYTPLTQGSAGNGGGLYGGGVIRLKVDGRLTNNGIITSNGPIHQGAYAPSGGSVYITAGSLEGSGIISSDGSNGTSAYPASGGGRVAVYLTAEDSSFDDYAGTITAYPGKNGSSVTPDASCGTIYLETKAHAPRKGELIINNLETMSSRLRYAGVTEEDGVCEFSRIVLTNGARFAVLTGATVAIDEIASHTTGKSAITIAGGTIQVPNQFEITNFNVYAVSPSSKISFKYDSDEARKIMVRKGATLCLNHPIEIDGSLDVCGVLSHESNAYNKWSQESDMVMLNLKVNGDMTVNAGGVVNAKGAGYAATFGPGAPITTGGGGSHGGLATKDASTTYGSIRCPKTHGSGGSKSSGGGVIKLDIRGSLTVNGRIDADASNYSGGGWASGAGGSVWIIADSLSGTGQVRACGGVSGNPVGGGGRVAVTLTGEDETFDGFTGYIIARGGISANSSSDGLTSVPSGGAGTVYLRKGGEGEFDGTLIIENGKCANKFSAYISDLVADSEVGNVVVTNKAVLSIGNGATLKVHGNFFNYGSTVTGEVATADFAAGTLEFIDADKESIVSGTNAFAALKIDTPAKTIRFGTGDDDLVSILPGGSFFVNGAAGQLVGLKSENDADAWKLRVCEGAKVDVTYADVSLSDASYGALVTAFDSSGENAGNVNWSFLAAIQPGERIIWVGANSSSWANPQNWSLGRVPVATDTVVINGDSENSPELSSDTLFNDLIIEEGARLNLNSWSIVVSNNLSVAGTLGVSGMETLRAFGDVSLAQVAGDGLALVLAGGENQSVNTHANRFKLIDIVKPSGSVAFSGGFGAELLQCRPADLVSLVLTFSGEQPYSVVNADIAGALDGAAAVTMMGASAGQHWRLFVSRIGTFSGIALRDCDASGSVELSADAPSMDLGNNVNWRFNVAAARWIGSLGGYFTNEVNWSTGVVPDESVRVVIDTAAKINTDGEKPARIRELRIVEGAVLGVEGSQPLEIAEWLSVTGAGKATFDVAVSAARAYIGEGILTHTGPHALNVTNRLALTVALDMEIDVLGMIDVSSKGWKGKVGLGNETPVNENYNARASHGGRGEMGAACYGSVFYPSAPGTGSRVSASLCGGGTVRLVVGGNLLVNGKILSGSSIDADRGASGGSIWITAGSLSGSGRISAEGSYRLQYDWPGCGGRVAVYLTGAGSFDSFTGDINAYGGRFYDGVSFTYKPTSSCGTVYLQHALQADKCGTIILDNAGGTSRGLGVELPAPVDGDSIGDFANVKIVLRRGGALVLPSDLKVGDLVVEEEKAAIYLNDFRLKVGSALHRDGLGWCGITQKDAAKAYLDSIVKPGAGSLGRILWPLKGFSIIVR